jgi:hypothetical protein
LPATKVREHTYWHRTSGVQAESDTLDPHWPTIAPILNSIASHDLSDVLARLLIATNARNMGFAFDLLRAHVALLARARCGVWIDSYAPEQNIDDVSEAAR